MAKIPILFLRDDEFLVQMYQEYFDKKGFQSIVLRDGQKGIERAIMEGPSLVTLKADLSTPMLAKNMPIILCTDRNHKSDAKIEPLVNANRVMEEIRAAVE